MENETIQLSAYHEGARVVFTYLSGYTCDSMELPGSASGAGTRLNAGNDLTVVQAVLASSPQTLTPENQQRGVDVAKKLMTIYCAGACAEIFFQNNASIPAELDMDIPGQDLKMIEKIQAYLKKAIVDHPDDYPTQCIISVFKKLKDPEVWKAIELLAAKISVEESKMLKRFYIEDTLMIAGIRAPKATAKSGFNLGLHEDDTVKSADTEPVTSPFELMDLTPLDVMLRDFLKKIKKDWKEGELQAATAALHDIYKKYGE